MFSGRYHSSINEATNMAQTESGIKAILKNPLVYSVFTSFMGVKKARKEIVEKYAKAAPGDYLLDIGCGPAQALEYANGAHYYGFDSNPDYIRDAKNRWGDRGVFMCLDVSENIEDLPDFDVAMAYGVLHHLNDDEVVKLCELARGVLKPGGKLVTCDPCFAEGQSRIGHFIASRDRGRNVRTPKETEALVSQVFDIVKTEVRFDLLWIPKCAALIVECNK